MDKKSSFGDVESIFKDDKKDKGENKKDGEN